MFCISQDKKKAGRYCAAYACQNKPIKKKGGLCHKHFRRKRRELDPVECRFNDFKGNAKRRKKPFFVTIEQFRQWCKEKNYIIKKGRRGQNATIDRIINKEGYYIDNMQILHNKQNASKGASEYPF